MKIVDLYDKIYKLGLTPDEYFLLYFMVHGLNQTSYNSKDVILKRLKIKKFIDRKNNILVDPQILEESFDFSGKIFDFSSQITKYINLFPAMRLPSGSMARQNFNQIKSRFQLFFLDYNYDWETIYKATKNYIDYYKTKNYEYMRDSYYFIYKDNNSDLALECESVIANKESKSEFSFDKNI
jgi:hypothetical protein